MKYIYLVVAGETERMYVGDWHSKGQKYNEMLG